MELNLDAFWMPFTPNRAYKANPKLLVSAKGMYYQSHDGREILDGTAGLWCVNAGHCRDEIVQAVSEQVATLEFAPTFGMGHPKAFEAASKIAALAPEGLNKVFFTNSGSESVDTALKIALAYWRAKGQGSKSMFISRERAYHGVNMGGTSLAGIPNNRKAYGGNLLPKVEFLSTTHNPAKNAFSKGEPEHGVELAEELERLVALHDASNIAAVIIEPVAGATGVLPPPKGYLKRLREICDKHNILLIFDEVITGYGRLGTPFAAQYFNVIPDIITSAKGVTNATVPMGAVIAKDEIYDAVVNGGAEGMVEIFHGYTYSGHPVASAAACATLDLYAKEGIFEHAASVAPYWEAALHSLKAANHVVDIRNIGLVGAVELAPRAGAVGKRGAEVSGKLYAKGALVRAVGDILVMSPPLIIQNSEIDKLIALIAEVLPTIE